MKSFSKGKKRRRVKKILSIIGVIAVVILVAISIIISTTAKQSNSEIVWDEQMTVGNLEAKNYFIIYSDLVCPYCIAFENAIVENEDEFQKYIQDNDILVEVRLSDFLFEYGESNPIHSRYSAVASYCAKDEGRFWDYYNLAVTRVWDDFFDGNGKNGFSELNKQDKSYWTKIGKEIGLGESFESCIENQTPLAEIKENALKSAKLANGMPYFKFNKFVSSGFTMEGDWGNVLRFFEAGLES